MFLQWLNIPVSHGPDTFHAKFYATTSWHCELHVEHASDNRQSAWLQKSLRLGKMVTDLDPGIFASTLGLQPPLALGATSRRKFGCRFLDPDLDLVSIGSITLCHFH